MIDHHARLLRQERAKQNRQELLARTVAAAREFLDVHRAELSRIPHPNAWRTRDHRETAADYFEFIWQHSGNQGKATLPGRIADFLTKQGVTHDRNR